MNCQRDRINHLTTEACDWCDSVSGTPYPTDEDYLAIGVDLAAEELEDDDDE